MSVTLVKGATTVTLPDPVSGKALSEKKRQVVGRTQGGTVVTHDLGVDTYDIELSFDMLTAAEKSSLQSFFHTDADGVMNTWTYTDEFSNSYTARFLSPELDFQQAAKDIYSVTFTIETSSIGV